VQVNLALQVALSGSVTMLAVGEAKATTEAGGEAVGIHDHRGRAHGVHQLPRHRVRALQREDRALAVRELLAGSAAAAAPVAVDDLWGGESAGEWSAPLIVDSFRPRF
jgi:hypothetical protein